jgi:peptide deformylase
VKYTITTFGNTILRKKASEVKEISEEIKRLAASLLETMYDAEGLGLAAEQVGRIEAICVVDVPAEFQESEFAALNANVKMPLVLINPVISDPEGSLRRKEGCLSFPDMYMEVTRPRSCTVSYMALDGSHYEARVHGLLARAVMHEVDHLDGVLFIDKLSSAQKVLCAGKLRRLKAETKNDPNQQ